MRRIVTAIVANFRMISILAVGTLGFAALAVLALHGDHGLVAAAAGGSGVFLIGGMHQSPSDESVTALSYPPQSLTGAGGAQSGSTHDMKGWEGILFSILVGDITGAGALDAWAQSGANANASDMANISGSNLTQVLAATENNVNQIDIYRPTNRYVRIQVNQTVNTLLVGATAMRYRRTGINPGSNVGQATQSPSQIVKVVQN